SLSARTFAVNADCTATVIMTIVVVTTCPKRGVCMAALRCRPCATPRPRQGHDASLWRPGPNEWELYTSNCASFTSGLRPAAIQPRGPTVIITGGSNALHAADGFLRAAILLRHDVIDTHSPIIAR